MANSLDLMGQKFGRLTVTEYLGMIKNKRWWAVKCDCGNENLVDTGRLRNGRTQSCGCLLKESLKKKGKNLKHGGRRNRKQSTEYHAWANLKQSNYVTMVPEWNDFKVFFKDMGFKPTPDHRIGRRDAREQHGPMNTYWRDPNDREQQRNLASDDLGDEFFIDMRAIARANYAAKERERTETGVLR